MNKNSRLHQKLKDAFEQLEMDFYPCFDWQFPPPNVKATMPTPVFEQRLSEVKNYSIYLHVPFCLSVCKFCYYSVSAAKENAPIRENYFNSLMREIKAYAKAIPANAKCESVYIGGGTPTAMGSKLTAIVNTLYEKFDLSECREFTVESSPNTLHREYLEELKLAGVNRVSYGVQTLDQEVLHGVNRHYDIKSIIEDLKILGNIIGNFNVDTMYDLPGETDWAIINTLETLTKYSPGITMYALDPIREKGSVAIQETAREAQRKFHTAKKYLTSSGYKQLFQNNFVREGGSYIHQIRRWDNLPVLAIGPSSQGYLPRFQYTNVNSIRQYVGREGDFSIEVQQELDLNLEIARELTTKLRFTGVNVDEFNKKYGFDLFSTFSEMIDVLIAGDQLEFSDGILKLTIAGERNNNIVPMLFSPDEITRELCQMKHPLAPVFGDFGQRQSSVYLRA
jgi:coproporphyrinogen III oxidase-like Fe-S oxidoreductase